jgi:threonylcarbamoyladenosine tRNA methylthiotransferase MtaB
MKYSVITFGCRVNQADSLGFEEEFLSRGARPAPPEEADVVVINTCSVTSSADQGARQTIRRLSRHNPDARIIVTGCYATRRPTEVAALGHVAQVVANPEKPRLVPLVLRTNQSLGTAERFANGDGPCGATIEPGVAGRTAFTLRVQTGCSEPCSYCIIPTTRGAPESRPLDLVLTEINRVASAGFKEIAITGVHLGSYGRDLAPPSSLTSLLTAISDRLRNRDLRFRISSLEPMDCTEEIVRLLSDNPCFAPHFHLPLQHASPSMLKAMRRPYTIEAYAELLGHIRKEMAHAALGTDVIVGFPGETDRDFDELVTFLEDSPLTHVHVFPYSDRPGTAASDFPDKVPGGVVRERAGRVREISGRLTSRFRARQLGTLHRALTLDDGTLAVTGNYLKVQIAPGRQRNEWVTLRVGERAGSLMGEVLDA